MSPYSSEKPVKLRKITFYEIFPSRYEDESFVLKALADHCSTLNPLEFMVQFGLRIAPLRMCKIVPCLFVFL